MFDRIFHADWSVAPGKRWVTDAARSGPGWRVARPQPVGPSTAFLATLLAASRSAAVLAGFDFPIGLPLPYGRQTGFPGFRTALAAFGTAPGWDQALTVAASPAAVGLQRPFYPRTAIKGTRRADLVAALGVASYDDLLRLCERPHPGRRSPCSVFWTLGANQVGRAAISGWTEILRPALAHDTVRLWPFDGSLDELARRGGLTFAETYPADAYRLVDAPFGPTQSKRRQADRAALGPRILAWGARNSIDLSACAADLRDGFGAQAAGDDAFDSLVGALAALLVADGRLPAMPDHLPPGHLSWEGWILGRGMDAPGRTQPAALEPFVQRNL